MNYAALVAAVSAYCENTFETVDMNVFITEAELRCYNTVQIPALRKNVTGTTTISNPYLSCPTDFLSSFSLAVIAPVTGAYTYLLNKDVNFIRECYSVPATTGTPKYYALFGPRSDAATELTFILGPTPDAAYTAELHYNSYPESIVTAGTSWLGDNFDPVLLYGTLIEAYTFMKGEADLLQLYVAKYTEAMQQLKRLCDGLQRGDAYRDGQAKVKVP
jgi:hypothetical protein